MFRPTLFTALICACALTFSQTPAHSQGFSTLKAAGQGLDKSGGDEEDGDGKEGSSAKSGGGSGGKTGGKRRSGKEDYLFIGAFQIYLPSKRTNARLSVYGDPAQFKYADRTCNRIRQVRDRINTYLFKNPPELNNRGKIINPDSLDKGIRKSVKRAMKTKREYFNSFYVFNGRFSELNIPKDLENKPVTDCKGVAEKAKELAKEK